MVSGEGFFSLWHTHTNMCWGLGPCRQISYCIIPPDHFGTSMAASLFLDHIHQVTNKQGHNMISHTGLQFNFKYISVTVTIFAHLRQQLSFKPRSPGAVMKRWKVWVVFVVSFWWLGESMLACWVSPQIHQFWQNQINKGSRMSALRNFLLTCTINTKRYNITLTDSLPVLWVTQVSALTLTWDQ